MSQVRTYRSGTNCGRAQSNNTGMKYLYTEEKPGTGLTGLHSTTWWFGE
jgi:hypothetical protein